MDKFFIVNVKAVSRIVDPMAAHRSKIKDKE
jgi:hypothetical protein